MAPTTVSDWIDIAKERTKDADAILKNRSQSIGAVYMAGYAIECSLKALLRYKNKPFPKHGNQGHNLRGLWEAAGLRLSDIRDPTGAKTFFIENWDTSLRYELTCNSSLTMAELVDGAKQLTKFIKFKISPKSRRRR
ncbi:MAG: HEPN domain-containing protein [Moorea sp. SIOASIH]|uniref:HEPN domain-containing protein n=1 Tax=Moorena sp. SIOASIH TaxID=2607817 RepID=UPI0013B6E992|nr:HEPN domain-containing protein [Moorena sp. SIOASIH]NEO42085.1 HEPN domain-containing protein [Moorena sp. SIOASIH]